MPEAQSVKLQIYTRKTVQITNFNSYNFAHKKVLVMGLGRFGGGVGLCKFLAKQHAIVTVTDTADERSLADSLDQLKHLSLKYHLDGHHKDDFKNADLVVVNPAVKKNSPWLSIARDHHVPTTSEMNIFFQRCPAPIIAVTGTNGKSTTAAMIHTILTHAINPAIHRGDKNQTPSKPLTPRFIAGIPQPPTPHTGSLPPENHVWLGGNIGKENLLQLVEQIQPQDLVVLELSSFQLHDLEQIQCSPHVAVVTNLTPNHLDWHDTLESYTHAKQNILRFQQKTDHAVLNRQDPALADWPNLTPAQIHWTHTDDVAQLELPLPGRHNAQNAAAALAVAKIFDINFQTIQHALKHFHPLPHRLQLIRRLNEVDYYNDSIATTPQSVLAAIAAIPQKKILILGGCDNNIPFDDLINTLVNPPVPNSSVETVILIGQTQNKLASLLESEKKKQNSKTPHTQIAPTMQDAVTIAQKIATPHSAILLSPGCASYDMFKNFENRGNTFSSLVNDLPD